MSAYTCTRCGADNASPIVAGPKNVPTGEYLCCSCWNQSVADRRAARKAELAAMPRCAICRRRGTWQIGREPTVLLCGTHRKAAQAELQRRLAPVASIAMFTDVRQTGEQILAMLREVTR